MPKSLLGTKRLDPENPLIRITCKLCGHGHICYRSAVEFPKAYRCVGCGATIFMQFVVNDMGTVWYGPDPNDFVTAYFN
jgi:ribosomal protein S27E